MLKSEAINLIGCSDKVFYDLVENKTIRKTPLKNGRYSYNDDDIYNFIKISKNKLVKDSYIPDINIGSLKLLVSDFRSCERLNIVCRDLQIQNVLKELFDMVKKKDFSITIKETK